MQFVAYQFKSGTRHICRVFGIISVEGVLIADVWTRQIISVPNYHTSKTPAKYFDICTAQTYELREDDQELRSKRVAAIINKNIKQQVDIKYISVCVVSWYLSNMHHEQAQYKTGHVHGELQ